MILDKKLSLSKLNVTQEIYDMHASQKYISNSCGNIISLEIQL